MGLKEKIHSVNKEASLYKSQGMYEEALDKYKELLKLVSGYEGLKNKSALEKQINGKISEIKKRLNFYENEDTKNDISEDKKEIIKKLFSEKKDDPDYKKFEEALTLARFGQFEDAVNDLTPFLENKTFRYEAASNIVQCYRNMEKETEAEKLIGKWKKDGIISEKEASVLSGRDEQLVTVPQEKIYPDDMATLNESSDKAAFDSDSPEIMEIESVGIKLTGNENINSDPVELDVSFQTGNHLSLIISSKEKNIIDNLDVGLKLNDMCFYSPIAVFKSSGIVLSKHRIESGPKKGDWCLDIEIKNPT
jgi:tetratricopeptide (TPR) repeat protein